MSKSAPLNRREWLKATGATVAGVVLATRLPGSGAPGVGDRRDNGNGAPKNPATSAQARGDRQYIHGFEPYPFP
jgi:hypothetical protein